MVPDVKKTDFLWCKKCRDLSVKAPDIHLYSTKTLSYLIFKLLISLL